MRDNFTVVPLAPKQKFNVWNKSFNMKSVGILLVTLIIAYLSLIPIITLVLSSFQGPSMDWTLQNFVRAFSNAWFYRMFFNSLQYAFGSTLISLTIGFILAWIFVRTSTPGKILALLTAVIPFIIPGVLKTVAWILLLSPEIGQVNMLLASILGFTPFSIYSMGGMIWIQALNLLPISFFMLMATLRSMDSSFEEAAYASGANKSRTFFHVTLKLAAPGLISATLLLFVQSIASFEVPFFIGRPAKIDVFVNVIYDSLRQFPIDNGLAGALAMVVLVIAVLGVVWANKITQKSEKFATITGKGFKPVMMDLGKWNILSTALTLLFFLIIVILPLAILLWTSLLPNFEKPSLSALKKLSFLNFQHVFNYPEIIHAFANSLTVSISAAAITIGVTTMVAYITIKTKFRLRSLLDGLAFIPIAVPGTVMGVSILLWYLVAPLPFRVYGTLFIIIIAFVTHYLPYGMRYMTSGMVQIKDELEEASLASGASWLKSFWYIYRPLLVPSILGGFIYVFVAAFREASISVFLVGPNTQLVPIVVMSMWHDGKFPEIAALGIIMIAVLVIAVVALQRISKRTGQFFF
jgi:iron(III) transport system permease protein